MASKKAKVLQRLKTARQAEANATRRKYRSWMDVLTEKERSKIKQQDDREWRRKRDHLVCTILEENPKMLRFEALMLANKQMNGK